MRVLLVGAGGVGAAAAGIATHRGFHETFVVADHDADRAGKVVARLGDDRFLAERVDAVPFLDKLVEYGTGWQMREQ
jgi:saccharopine dehydrogenase (NAD+, L-lysine-forming)